MVPDELCERVHAALLNRPLHSAPNATLPKNGLYFFYELGETSVHGVAGRIVRVGNHPRSQDALVRRLRDHYSGNKNGSVFRRLLGGALLRRANLSNPCLAPAPGQGHWETHGLKSCEDCRPIEMIVSQLLRDAFAFRCVRVEDRAERNRLEASIIAALAGCSACRASAGWLGHFAYSQVVRSSGLWNSDYVSGSAPPSNEELLRFERLAAASEPGQG